MAMCCHESYRCGSFLPFLTYFLSYYYYYSSPTWRIPCAEPIFFSPNKICCRLGRSLVPSTSVLLILHRVTSYETPTLVALIQNCHMALSLSCVYIYLLFWLRNTSVIVETYQWSFCVFMCGFHLENTSFFW